MPNYNYACLECGKPFQIFLSYAEYDTAEAACPHCGSAEVKRRLGRVRFARSEASRLSEIADPGQMAAMEDDPKAMAKMMKQMSSQLGHTPDAQFNEVVGRLEKGHTPEQIEKDLGD